MKKIALVRLSALGDIVNSIVVLGFIKQHYKDIQIDWIVEEGFAPILEGHPLIDNVYTVSLKKLKKEKSFALLKQNVQKLRSLDKYDLVIDMQGLLKSAIVARLISPNTHGFSAKSSREGIGAFFYKTLYEIGYAQNIVKRNCGVVASALGFEITDEMLLKKEPLFEFEKFKFSQTTQQNVAFVIGASWESKRYPKELVAKVCELLDVVVHIIWASKEEKEDAEWIVQHSSHAQLAPKMNLKELVGFLSSVDLVIGNDTGPTHIAWAQNIPSITLFGPTSTRMIYQTPINRGIESPSDVDIFHIDKKDFSIKEIPPQQVAQEALALLH